MEKEVGNIKEVIEEFRTEIEKLALEKKVNEERLKKIKDDFRELEDEFNQIKAEFEELEEKHDVDIKNLKSKIKKHVQEAEKRSFEHHYKEPLEKRRALIKDVIKLIVIAVVGFLLGQLFPHIF